MSWRIWCRFVDVFHLNKSSIDVSGASGVRGTGTRRILNAQRHIKANQNTLWLLGAPSLDVDHGEHRRLPL